MTPDEAKSLRKGDVVLVRMVVDEDPVFLLANPPKWGVSLDNISAAHNGYFNPTDIISVEPRPLAVGDRVKWSAFGMGTRYVRILAIAEGRAMIADDHDFHASARLEDLTPANPQPSDKEAGE